MTICEHPKSCVRTQAMFNFSNTGSRRSRSTMGFVRKKRWTRLIRFKPRSGLMTAASCRPISNSRKLFYLSPPSTRWLKCVEWDKKSRGIDRKAPFWNFSCLYPGSLHGVSGGTLTGIDFSASPCRICTPSTDHGLTVFVCCGRILISDVLSLPSFLF